MIRVSEGVDKKTEIDGNKKIIQLLPPKNVKSLISLGCQRGSNGQSYPGDVWCDIHLTHKHQSLTGGQGKTMIGHGSDESWATHRPTDVVESRLM